MKKTVEAAGFQFTFEAKAIFNKERVPYDPHQSMVSESISHRSLSNQLLPFVCVCYWWLCSMDDLKVGLLLTECLSAYMQQATDS